MASLRRGLPDACGDALPQIVRFYYGIDADPKAIPSPRDELVDAFTAKACLDMDVAKADLEAFPQPSNRINGVYFIACKFERYAVMDFEEASTNGPALMTWALHQWFLDHGLSPAEAKPITRALFRLERARLGQ